MSSRFSSVACRKVLISDPVERKQRFRPYFVYEPMCTNFGLMRRTATTTTSSHACRVNALSRGPPLISCTHARRRRATHDLLYRWTSASRGDRATHVPPTDPRQVVRKITFRGPMIVGRQILAGWQAVESAIRPREIALRNLSISQSD
jgi:hypothetical protein